MPYGTVNADLMTTSDGVSSAGLYGFKNRIINGAMVIDQRNAGASVTPSGNGSGDYLLDRWLYQSDLTGKVSVQQSSTAPTGFTKSMLVTSLSAYSVISTSRYIISQRVEGQNVSDLAWGTASAAPITLSFWVRSSLTGTFGGTIFNTDGTRNYGFSYTISAANTWEQKSVTIAGDTTGTWLTTNGTGVAVNFSLGVGSSFAAAAGSWGSSNIYGVTGQTNVVGTNGATWYVTGVQLEKGSTATSFDVLDYGRSLIQCQRYFLMLGGNATNDNVASGQAFTTTTSGFSLRFPTTMRGIPTLDTFTASNWSVMNGSGSLIAATAISLGGSQTSLYGCQLSVTVASGLTAGQGSQILANTSNARLPLNAEL